MVGDLGALGVRGFFSVTMGGRVAAARADDGHSISAGNAEP